MDFAEDTLQLVCSFCRSHSGDLQTVACLYELGCPGHVNVCRTCRRVKENLPCSACFRREWQRKCYACNQQWIRFASQQYGMYCASCFRLHTERGQRTVLEEEAAEYLEKLALPAAPTGEEAALQSLVLPIHNGPELAPYAKEPSYLSPLHCRICHANCEQIAVRAPCAQTDMDGIEESERDPVDQDSPDISALPLPRQTKRINTGVDPRVEQHVIDAHGFKDAQEYRRHVFGREMATGLQPVTAQVVRTRLTAWKQGLTDEAFAEGVCSCCAQTCLRKTIVSAVFPPKASATPPPWLGWSAEQWEMRSEIWYDKISALFDTERVLQKQFHADDRVRDADAELLRVRETCKADGGDASRLVAISEAFAHRVRGWRKYTQEDLRRDGVPSPSDASKIWLLFHRSPAKLHRGSDGSIACELCETCARSLTKVDGKGTPTPTLPLQACANGLWQGPEPKEISSLTWAERRVLRLGRVYCTVKRVLANVAPWARDNPDALPQYTTRNVVAFLQNPDGAVKTLCLLPDDLAKDVHLQFETSDPTILVREPSVQVDIQVLRRAIWWYATHCYQWLDATKEHELFGFDQLGSELEHLLNAYRQSFAGETCGVPNTLTEIATGIKPDQISVQQHGPADVDEESEDREESDEANSEDANENRDKTKAAKPIRCHDSSMVVSSSGLDEIGPLSLWAKAMSKYEILNQLKEQYDTAALLSDEGAKQAAVREEAQCLAEAVHALRGLASSETQKILKQFHEHMQGSQVVVPVGHDTKLLNTFDPHWWVYCFTDIFFRGDFAVPKGLGLRRWGAALIMRRRSTFASRMADHPSDPPDLPLLLNLCSHCLFAPTSLKTYTFLSMVFIYFCNL